MLHVCVDLVGITSSCPEGNERLVAEVPLLANLVKGLGLCIFHGIAHMS